MLRSSRALSVDHHPSASLALAAVPLILPRAPSPSSSSRSHSTVTSPPSSSSGSPRPVHAASVANDRGLVVALCGTTATGKGRLAAELAASIGGEIVSVDSVKLYSGCDIGSNKRALVEHARHHGVAVHLVDVAPPSQPLTLGGFVARARAAISEVQGRGRVPVLVGGTAMYMEGAVGALPLSVPARDAATTATVEAELALDGGDWDASLARLAAVDPRSAQALSRNDRFRLVRALEVYARTGQPRSDFVTMPSSPSAVSLSPYDVRAVCLTRVPRTALYHLADARCEAMLLGGLVREAVDAVVLHGLDEAAQSGPARAIGYANLLRYLRSHTRPAPEHVPPLLAEFQADTRRLARRQLGYFRHAHLPLLWRDGSAAPHTLLAELRERLSMPEHAWHTWLASDAVQQENARLSVPSPDEAEQLRVYRTAPQLFDVRSRAGRANIDALVAELTEQGRRLQDHHRRLHATPPTAALHQPRSDEQ